MRVRQDWDLLSWSKFTFQVTPQLSVCIDDLYITIITGFPVSHKILIISVSNEKCDDPAQQSENMG